VSTG
jgi:hypothetical protein